MKQVIVVAALVLAAVVFSALDTKAKTAEERAGELVKWRELCNDPDPDLRLGYIESAISSGDISVQRICIKSALESDNSDIRNFGLRAAIASLQQITFSVELPTDVQAALKNANGSQDEINKIVNGNRYTFSGYGTIKNGLTFVISGAKVSSAQSTWYSLAGQSSKKDDFKGTATISGENITWQGKSFIDYQDHVGSISLKLEPGGVLRGTYQPNGGPLYPISAKLW